MEVKTRIFCVGEECQEQTECWADISIVNRDTSDSFQTSSTPEIEMYPTLPDDWSVEGGWTRRYYCGGCSQKNRELKSKKRKS